MNIKPKGNEKLQLGDVNVSSLNVSGNVGVGGNITWGNHSCLVSGQGGCIELGGDGIHPGTGTPYIDFHYNNQRTEDYNVRIINNQDSYLSVNGNLNVVGLAFKPGGGSWNASSDRRMKKNVKKLNNPLDKLLSLHGYSFVWKEPEKQGNLIGPQVGLIAQDVEKVFPEWVGTGPDGYKFISVRGFEALTIESFRELKTENLKLQKQISSLQRRLKVVENKAKLAKAK